MATPLHALLGGMIPVWKLAEGYTIVLLSKYLQPSRRGTKRAEGALGGFSTIASYHLTFSLFLNSNFVKAHDTSHFFPCGSSCHNVSTV